MKADLEQEVGSIFRDSWSRRTGVVVPEPESLRLSNDGCELEATVLYADMADSTKLVDTESDQFAAEIYKTFLTCCARIIKSQDGVITSYDGDRVMAVYVGGSKNTSAVKSGLMINYALRHIIRPKLAAQYPHKTFLPDHAVGIDTSKILAARIGVKNDNDIVWVGRAANHAAKLCGLRDGEYRTWITDAIFSNVAAEVKATGGRDMWEPRTWTSMGGQRIYRSNWGWIIP